MVQVTVVVVTEEEIASITPQSNKNIQVVRFVDRSEIPDTFFDAPYLAAPDGVASNKLYILFKTVLQHTNKVAIGKVILRDREEPVVISAVEDGLIIQTLRFAREVRNFSVLPAPAKPEAIADQELELCGFGHKVKSVGHKVEFVGHKMKLRDEPH